MVCRGSEVPKFAQSPSKLWNPQRSEFYSPIPIKRMIVYSQMRNITYLRTQIARCVIVKQNLVCLTITPDRKLTSQVG